MSSTNFYNILLPIATAGVYTYCSGSDLTIGERVCVPFGKRNVNGIVLAKTQKPEFECKEVLMCIDDNPMFTKEWLDFLIRLSEYYAIPLGLALHGTVADSILNMESVSGYERKEHKVTEITLTKEQRVVFDNIDISNFSRHLIHGITGSGKTEIYLEVAKEVIKNGKQVLYIVPEISLTPQLTERIAERFGYTPAVFHSKISTEKRMKTFSAFASGEEDFLIGARSSLFVPAKRLGLIIIDEEHEQSFKQEDSPPYHLRDMAVLYASILQIPIIMGSATPSLESMLNVKLGKYKLHKLLERPNDARLPKIEVIDAKKYDLISGVIAEPIFDKLSEVVKKGEQAIILLNRKGYSTSLFCKRCGEVAVCPSCSVGLVYFKSKNSCNCRYCNTDYRKLKCSKCGDIEFTEYGAGTEKVAEILEDIFPNNVIRLDIDTAGTLKTLSSKLKAFEKKEVQILVGTQIVAKGLHFPEVTFVGVLGIDNILALPDFRATERAFQLLVQVSGRAGRQSLAGEVFIQTMNPNSPIFEFIEGDFDGFYQYELERRKTINYPPFSKMARLLVSQTDSQKCWNVANAICKSIKESCSNIRILGPAEANIAKVKNRYRVSILLISDTHNPITKGISTAAEKFSELKYGSMMLKTDKDPYILS